MFNTLFVRRRVASITWLVLVCLAGLLAGLVKPLVSGPAWARTRAVLVDGIADRVLGQSTFSTNGGEVTASGSGGPAGIGIAPAGSPSAGRIFVVDYGNHRVLSWPSATGFSNGASADLVLGQGNFTSNAGGLEAYKLFGPEAVVMDASGNLYVADTENNRVLQFRPPFSNGMSASVVFGQPNFVTPNNQANRGGATAANTLYYPRGLGLDASGKLYVTDTGNSRVLRYAPPFSNGMAAELVIGQANFTDNAANRNGITPEANTLSNPKGLAVDSAGHLYVADFGNHRVLRFDPNLSNGQNASKAFGQPSYTEAIANNGGRGAGTLHQPIDIAVSWAGTVLYVTDQLNIRVLGYDTPLTSDTQADSVFGQPNFSTAAPNYNGISATSLNQEPLGVAIDASGGLYVADFGNNRVLAYDFVNQPAATPTSTPNPTQTQIPTQTQTPTQTPTGPQNTPTPIPTPTQTPEAGVGDAFETDDGCAVAQAVATDGRLQQHTFHKQADQDWVRFEAISGTTYVVQGQVGPGSSADLTLEAYEGCTALPQAQNYAYSTGVRMELTARQDGAMFLKWTNAEAGVFGSAVRYNLNVTAISNTPPAGAVIIVAGRYKLGDKLQPNIHNMTNAVYAAFTKRGYASSNILYLATDVTMPGVTGLPTVLNLQNAITTWAKQRLANNQSLTLYLMDHGDPDQFYLDNTSSQTVTPQQLDGWLSEMENQFSGLKINVIVDACYSGSFIAAPNSLSKPGRVIVASTSSDRLAYASTGGAIFSDHFVAAISQGQSMFDAFSRARWSTQIAYPLQGPQLDDDGDGRANTLNDGLAAQQRGFNYLGSFPVDNFAPYIQSAETRASTQPNRREIRATILDDKKKITTAYAVIYPPSYVPPTAQTELGTETLERVLLADAGNETFSGLYSGFTERGRYRLVIYARDDKDEPAQPLELFVQNGSKVFLPMVQR